MIKNILRLSSICLFMVLSLSSWADTVERTIYSTTFQDWTKASASTTASTVDKTTTDNQTITFTLFNVAVDPEGTNAKFSAECCTAGYLQTAKDATNKPYVTTSAFKSITTLEVVQAATGSARGLTIFVKGDGDADWVSIHNKAVVNASGETLKYTINKTNCQIKFGAYAPDQNAYVLSMKVNGNIEVAPRTFTDFKIDFRKNPYTVVAPESGLPSGVTITGTFHESQHGYSNATVTVPVDGPVKFTIGGCQYSDKATVSVDGGTAIEIDTKAPGCDDAFGSYTKYATYTYNVEKAATLTFNLGSYCPYFFAEKCDYTPDVTVSYYNTDGKLIGKEVVQNGTKLAYKYSVADVTIPEGNAFRGWFKSKATTAQKLPEGTALTEDIAIYAHATPIENAVVGSHFNWDLTKNYFYDEDHEAIKINGSYTGGHGWKVNAEKSIRFAVGGKAVINIKNCSSSASQTATVTTSAGATVKTFEGKATSDGAVTSFNYDGNADTLTITYPSGANVHGVEVYNVKDFVTFDQATGYYNIRAGDGASLLMVLKSISSGQKIYLPNGTYDFGDLCLTSISASNISIVGESMDGTIIKNAPAKEDEGIGTTATFLNSSNGLYLQDLTLQNALDYYATGSAGRAVCLQDKGSNTICKNVKMLSYQDTYYSNAAKKFYWEDCEIHGTVDYLCGDGDVVYNRCKFINESRSATAKSGQDVIAAPFTDSSCKWGYVFLDCSVESKCTDFLFARSWGGNSAAQFVRTKILDNSLNASRWTIAGMNIAAYKFKEYGTTDKDGNVTTPASNVITFTHSSGNKTYETVLSQAEVANYTVANIFGTSWTPDQVAAQVTTMPASGTFLLEDGTITTAVPTSGIVRIANSRGGFGPKINAKTGELVAVNAVKAETIKAHNGKYVQNGNIIIINNGKKYTLAGVELK